MPRLVLASTSPRRRELLGVLGLPFEVAPSDFDEDSIPVGALKPGEWVMRLAEGKARAVAARTEGDAIVIGADTTVVLDGDTLNKPQDDADARRMLRRLSGQTHTVFTGLCLAETRNGALVRVASDFAQTSVTFAPLSHAVIDAYVATGEPRDKAGAYGIQGKALAFIPGIQGDYFNVVGLPLEVLYRLLLPCFPAIAPAPPQPHFPNPVYYGKERTSDPETHK